MLSDDPIKQSESELEELKKKVDKMNKNLNVILGIVRNIEERLNGKKAENKENHKERINKAFEKKQIGGSWEDKRKQYFEWITSGKITQPKEDTLAYILQNKKDPSNNSYVLLS